MQAICIIAHKDINQVIDLATKLSKRFYVIIHFDLKMKIDKKSKSILKSNKINYFSEIDVHWGGWSIGKVAYLLFREAMKNPEVTYVHLISGQDWPVMNLDKLYELFENNSNIYLSYKLAKKEIKSGQNTLLWQKFYFNYDRLNRRTFFGKIYHRFLMISQKLLHVDKLKRYKINLDIYEGANWVDLPRDATEYCINYLDTHPNLRKVFETGCFSDEFWVQTILANNLKYKKRITGDPHRYIVWKKRYDSYPAILDETDYKNVINKGYFFARKIDYKYSQNLIVSIDKYNNN